MNQASHERPRRPFGVTIVFITVLIFTLLNAVRMSTAFRQREFLTGAPLGVPVVYLILTGAAWTLVGMPLMFGLFTGRKWAVPMGQASAILYTLYYWIDKLLVSEPISISYRWPFVLGLTIILLLVIFWALSYPKAKAFFTRSDQNS